MSSLKIPIRTHIRPVYTFSRLPVSLPTPLLHQGTLERSRSISGSRGIAHRPGLRDRRGGCEE